MPRRIRKKPQQPDIFQGRTRLHGKKEKDEGDEYSASGPETDRNHARCVVFTEVVQMLALE